MEGKVVFITGANSGIGLGSALAIAKLQPRLYVACRSKARADEAIDLIKKESGNNNVFFIPLDLNDLNSVDECAKQFAELESKIDVLVNNAGMLAGNVQARTAQGFERAFGVNYLGHFLLTLHFLPLLQKAGSSRIVNLTSMTHSRGRIDFNTLEYWKLILQTNGTKGHINDAPLYTCTSLTPNLDNLYTTSKLAMILFSREFDSRFAHLGIICNSMCPGVVATNVLDDFNWFIRTYGPKVMRLIALVGYGVSVETAAKTTFLLATDTEKVKEGGKYWTHQKEKIPSAIARDQVSAVRLWDLSVELTNAKNRVPHYASLVNLQKPTVLSTNTQVGNYLYDSSFSWISFFMGAAIVLVFILACYFF